MKPFIVHSAGKCGSISVHNTLLKAGYNAKHFHFGKDIPKRITKAYVITPIRELLGQNISAYFENHCQKGIPTMEDFIQKWGNDTRCELFFDTEYPRWNIDVYSQPFDTDRGWQIYKNGNVQALVIRLEDFGAWGEAFRALTGRAAPTLLHIHKTRNRHYEQFRNKQIFPDWYRARLHQSKLHKHFYSTK